MLADLRKKNLFHCILISYCERKNKERKVHKLITIHIFRTPLYGNHSYQDNNRLGWVISPCIFVKKWGTVINYLKGCNSNYFIYKQISFLSLNNFLWEIIYSCFVESVYVAINTRISVPTIVVENSAIWTHGPNFKLQLLSHYSKSITFPKLTSVWLNTRCILTVFNSWFWNS